MLRRTLAVILTIVAVLAAGWLALRRADIPYDTLETIYSTPDTQFMTLDDGLKAGDIVLGGSFTRPIDIAAGDVVQADYGPLGGIGLRFE